MPDVVDHGEAATLHAGRATASAAAKWSLRSIWRGCTGALRLIGSLPTRYVRALRFDANARNKTGEVSLRQFADLSQGPRKIIRLDREELASLVAKEFRQHGMLWALERQADGGVFLHVRERDGETARHAIQAATVRLGVHTGEHVDADLGPTRQAAAPVEQAQAYPVAQSQTQPIREAVERVAQGATAPAMPELSTGAPAAKAAGARTDTAPAAPAPSPARSQEAIKLSPDEARGVRAELADLAAASDPEKAARLEQLGEKIEQAGAIPASRSALQDVRNAHQNAVQAGSATETTNRVQGQVTGALSGRTIEDAQKSAQKAVAAPARAPIRQAAPRVEAAPPSMGGMSMGGM